MNILLTNDDGVTAPGIWAAAEALADFGRVTIVAPASDYSGYGAAFPPSPNLTCFPYEHPDFDHPNVTAHGLACAPAACAHAGLNGLFGGPFDLLVSGINRGANMGRDVFYSGTFGAALTAHLLGVPAIAVSLDAGPAGVLHWKAAAWALAETVRLWLANPQATPALFNVNAPNLSRRDLAGTLITGLSDHSFLTRYRLERDAHAEHRLVAQRIDEPAPQPPAWSDAWAVRLGYVSVTPLQALPDLLMAPAWGAPAESIPLPTLTLGPVDANLVV